MLVSSTEGPHHRAVDMEQALGRHAVRLVQHDAHLARVLAQQLDHLHGARARAWARATGLGLGHAEELARLRGVRRSRATCRNSSPMSVLCASKRRRTRSECCANQRMTAS